MSEGGRMKRGFRKVSARGRVMKRARTTARDSDSERESV